ncbi:pilus assembly protein [Acetobacter fabarum]|uniref:TadE/TadG family type IV pilus assembly protein n=1 Tax=Acetobacter fabarum TaxID=483199 RepID=UPI00312B2E80
MLRNDRRGATAIEFALAFLFLIMVVVGTIEIGWQLETEAALRNGVDEAIRFASTGQSIVPNVKASPTCRAQAIVFLVTLRAPILLKAENLQITSAANNATVVPSGGSGFGGAGGDTMIYTFVYTQPYLTFFGRWIMHSSSMKHTVSSLVKNEPFSGTISC